MDKKHLITGQHIFPELKARTQELRRVMTPVSRRLRAPFCRGVGAQLREE
ncbi:MAG: hypothetical protein OEV06_07815 [Anaerolineae bacterium]|nr:hypothetical protein [Anaerolineae bacterium]